MVVTETSDSWPGTNLCSRPVGVYVLPITDSLLDLLFEAKSLFEWRHPALPEDLAFYTSDEQLWFYSTTHEFEWGINEDLARPDVAEFTSNLKVHWF